MSKFDNDRWVAQKKAIFHGYSINTDVAIGKLIVEAISDALIFCIGGVLFSFHSLSECIAIDHLLLICGGVGFASGVFNHIFKSGILWLNIFHIFVFSAMMAIVYSATGCA